VVQAEARLNVSYQSLKLYEVIAPEEIDWKGVYIVHPWVSWNMVRLRIDA